MLKKIRTFKGGFKFQNYPGQAKPLFVLAGIPLRVVIPLNRCSDVDVKPLVKKGDTVFAGQIIGRDDANILSPAHSSVNGIVEDIQRVNYFNCDTAMVAIRATDSSPEIKPLAGYAGDWQKLNNEKIEELIFLSGAASLRAVSPEKVKHIIIQETSAEAYNSSLDLILGGKNLLNFIEGAKILKKIMPQARVHLAVNRQHKKIISQIVNLTAQMDWFEVCAFKPKYPQGALAVLLPAILNQKIPYDSCAANLGVSLLQAQEVLAVYAAVTRGEPFVEKIVALCGPGFKENLHLKARIGTPLNEIIKDRLKSTDSVRLILNSLLSGPALEDLSFPLDKRFSQIIAIDDHRQREFLAFARPGLRRDSYSGAFGAHWLPGIKKSVDTNQHGQERPCISCGFCADVCPVRIIPHLLTRYVRREIINEILLSYEIFNCVECGLCSFVCPSKIPLLKQIKSGQEKLIAEGFCAKK